MYNTLYMIFNKDTARKKFLKENPSFLSNYKEQNNINHKKWVLKNPVKAKAHQYVFINLRNGNLIKNKCIKCGNLKTEAHHENYLKPLEVIWLCKLHNSELHKNKTI